MARLAFSLCLGSSVTGCSGGSGPAGPDGSVEPVVVSGAVQKGPFILGAQVQLNVLDSVGNPTGTVFNTTTTSDKGEFSVSVDPSVLDLVTNGFYYNESTWKLSAASISMRALTEITAGGPQEAYVNVLTHLARSRALNLYAGGTALSSSVSQAEGEVRGVFGGLFVPASLVPGTDMNLLGGDNPSNAYLLALSCYVSQVALNASDGTDNDAQLQQLMNNIAADLEADGAVSSTLMDQLDGVAGLGIFPDPYECVASLQKRLEDIGDLTTVLPDPQQVFDWDRDGIPNSIDPDADADGIDATNDPVVSLAVYSSQGVPDTQVLVVLRDSGRALQLLGPHPLTGAVTYAPAPVSDPQILTDVVEAVTAMDGIVIRRGDGTVHFLTSGDNLAPQMVMGVAGAAVAITVTMGNNLLVIDDSGNVTSHFGPVLSSPLVMSNVTRVAGRDPNYVYLDNVGAVRIVEGATVTDIVGLGGINIIDVAADFEVVTQDAGYLAVSDVGALYRFRAAAPTAVEDPTVTGISALYVSGTPGPPPPSLPARLFAVTAGGVWDLHGRGTGIPFQVSDVGGLSSFYGPVTWGESGIYAYVATDSAGDVQLIHFSDDLSINSLYRQVYVPR